MIERFPVIRQVASSLALVSVLGCPFTAFAQDINTADALAKRSDLGANSALAGIAANGSTLGRMDTNLGTPAIRSDDNAKAGTPGSTKNQSVALKPLQPNDFQKFIETNTGKSLPLYGAEFFSGEAGAFAPQSNTPVSADYRIGPGDEIQIKGWGSVDIDVRAVVDRNGLIHIPRVGSVNLAGVRSSQAEDTIRAAVARYYRDFELSVTQGQLRGMTIYVVGQARQPGAYQLAGTSTLISALFASGGPNQLGSMRHIQVKRADRVVTELDIYDFIGRGDKSADIKLQDGDTIVIPPARGFVALTGAVAVPAVYELDSDKDTLASILAVAGGLPVVADPKQAYLERIDPTQKPSRTVESFALDTSSLKKKLRNGDLLTILTLSPEFGNAITLRGNVDQQVRTPWRDGMRIRDLIPGKSFLMSRSSVQRQNNALRSDDNESSLSSRVGQLVDQVNFDYAVVERVNSQQVSMQLIPFNLGKALDDASSSDNLLLEPGDIVTVFSVNDVRVPQGKRQIFVKVEGEVASPGIYPMNANEGLLDMINKAGGLTPDAYLFGSAFYREEVREAQKRNLEKLVDQLEIQVQSRLNAAIGTLTSSSPEAVQASQLRMQTELQSQQRIIQRLRSLQPTGRVMLGISSNPKSQRLPVLRLENQDKLVVPPRPDFVYVLGAVNSDAALLWQPGKSISHYVDLSGATQGADLDHAFILRADGSVVTKNSTGWLSRGVAGVKALPGDTIVLPEKIISESGWSVFTRNAKDITQIIYQFSLGAAAIKTLRD